jgi:hypothetical protein
MDFAALKAWVKASLEAHSEWYKEAREAYDFVAGRQWDEDEEQAFKGTNRPPIKFNLVGPTINAVCGMEVNNRQEVKFLPRTMGDAQVNERLTDLADWARQECQAEDEESAAFRDNVICGRGRRRPCWISRRSQPARSSSIVAIRWNALSIPPHRKPTSPIANMAATSAISTPTKPKRCSPVCRGRAERHMGATIDIHDGGEGNKRDYPEETRGALRIIAGPSRSASFASSGGSVSGPTWWRCRWPAAAAGQRGDYEKGKAALEAAGQPVPPAQPVWVRKYKQAFLGPARSCPIPKARRSRTSTASASHS